MRPVNTDIPSLPGDFKYESGTGKLPSPYLIITMVIHGPIDSTDHEGLFGALKTLDALMVALPRLWMRPMPPAMPKRSAPP